MIPDLSERVAAALDELQEDIEHFLTLAEKAAEDGNDLEVFRYQAWADATHRARARVRDAFVPHLRDATEIIEGWPRPNVRVVE